MYINKLLRLIDGKKITKAYIVKKADISRPALDSILAGNDFKVSNLEKIAAALNVPVGYFFDEPTTSATIHTEGDFSPASETGNISITEVSAGSVTDLRQQIAQLKSQLADKEKIIQLLERN